MYYIYSARAPRVVYPEIQWSFQAISYARGPQLDNDWSRDVISTVVSGNDVL